eukprot:scaffold3.g6236.t1
MGEQLEGGKEETGGPRVADAAALEQFAALDAKDRVVGEALRGVLAETALTACVRYPWRLLRPLLHAVLDALFADYSAETEDDVGPPRPIPGYGGADALHTRLHALIDSHAAAPFTVQRLCEVLLEPRKQYRRLDKAGLALEKLLNVTSCVAPDPSPPPLPLLVSLGPVNENPHSPYQDGRPPNIVQPAPAGAAQGDGEGQPPGHDGPGGLPNGTTYGPAPAPGGGDAFAFFLDAEIVGSSGTEASGQPIGPQPVDAGGGAAPAPPLDAAEVARAEAFVEAVIAGGGPAPGGRPEGGGGAEAGGGEGPGPASPPEEGRSGAASPADESVPPTPEGPSLQPVPGKAGSGGAATEAAAPDSPTQQEGGAAMDTDQPSAAAEQQAAMDADPSATAAEAPPIEQQPEAMAS